MRRERIGASLLLAPCLLVVVSVIGYPLVHGLGLSFQSASLLGRPREWVGVANYAALLADDAFWEAAWTTLLFTASSAGISFVLGVAVAMAFNRRFAGRTLVAMLVLLPWVFPAIVTATLFKLMLSPDIGVIDQVARAFGLIDRSILIDERALLISAIAADIWRATPFVALLVLAALRTVPEGLHDAARTEGAGALRRAFHVTLPLLRPLLLVVLFLRTLDALRVYDLIWVMSGRQLSSLSSYVFENVLRSELRVPVGAAGAVAFVLIVILLALLFLMLGASRPTGAEGVVGGEGEIVARHQFSGPLARVAFGALVIAAAAAAVLPLLWVAKVSIVPMRELVSSPPAAPPRSISGMWFEDVLNFPPFLKALANSGVIAACTTILVLVVSTPAAYVLARGRSQAGRYLLPALLAAAFLPPVVVLVPLFLTFSSLEIINTYWAMILPDTAFALPIAVWLLTAYLRGFPDEIEAAARVDGASTLQVLVKVVAPMAAGGLAAVGAVVFLLTWNEFLFANIFTFDETARPVTVLLAEFVQPLTFAYGPAAAASLIVALPLAAAIPILHSRFIARDR